MEMEFIEVLPRYKFIEGYEAKAMRFTTNGNRQSAVDSNDRTNSYQNSLPHTKHGATHFT